VHVVGLVGALKGLDQVVPALTGPIEVDHVGDLDVRGFFGLDTAVRPGFSEIRVEVRLTGPETAERYAELQRAVDEHCPVLDLFTNRTPVRSTLVVDGA